MNEHYAGRFEFGNTPARATIEVSSFPEGADIAYTGVAVRDLGSDKRSGRRTCRQARPRAPACSPVTPSTVRRRRIHPRTKWRRVRLDATRCGRRCETFSTTWKKRGMNFSEGGFDQLIDPETR